MPTNKSKIMRRTPRTLGDVVSFPEPEPQDSSFLRSRKNKLGITAAVGVVALHLVVGLGFLWPVVAAASYGGVALMTPPKKTPEPPEPSPADQARELETILYAQLGLVGNVAPAAVQNKFLDMYEDLHWILEHWEHYTESWAAQASIRSIIQEHIPDVLDAYMEVIGRDKQENIKDIDETLDILQKEAVRIRHAAEENSVSALRERTLAVKLQYGVMPVVEDNDRYDEKP